jgi:phosphoribosylanthranilate isomerase
MTDAKVKICGLTQSEDVAAAAAAGADYCGFVFVPGSPRHVSQARAADLVRTAHAKGAMAVGVFMDQDPFQVAATARRVQLDIVQLHGAEVPQDWSTLDMPPVVKRVQPDDDAPLRRTWTGRAAALLVDPGAGTGRAADLDTLSELGAGHWIAGGLGPGTVRRTVEAVRPAVVDVSSGVERGRGVKDHGQMRTFVVEAKQA